MKKLILLFVLVIMSFVCLVGCSTQAVTQVKVFKTETESLSVLNKEVNNWLTSQGNTIEVISVDLDTFKYGYYYITVVYKENIKKINKRIK